MKGETVGASAADSRLASLAKPLSWRESLSSSLETFGSQYTALVIKNLRLVLRNWKGTIGLLLAPVLVVIFLVVMQQVANLILKHSDPHPIGRPVSSIVPACTPAHKKTCYSVVYAPANVPWVNNLMRSVAESSGLDFDKYFLGMGNANGIWSWETDNSTMYDWFIHNQNVTQTGVLFTGPYVNPHAQGEFIGNELGYWLYYNQSSQHATESTMLAIEQQISNQLLKRNVSQTRLLQQFHQQVALKPQTDALFQNSLLDALAAMSTDTNSDFPTETQSFGTVEFNQASFEHQTKKYVNWAETMESQDSDTFSDKAQSSEEELSMLVDRLSKMNFTFEVTFKEFPITLLRIAQLSLANQSGGTLYFIPPMIIFFVLLTEVVSEKESKLRVGMKMMGLSNAAYWSSWYTHGFMWVFVITGIQYLAGLACGYTFFTRSNAFSVLALFWTFGIAMMTVAFFISTLISSSKTAQTVGYAVILVGFVFQAVLNSLNGALVDMLWLRDAANWIVAVRYILSMYPPFSLAKAWSDISSLSSAVPSITEGMIVEGPGFFWRDMYKYRVIIDTPAFYVASPPPAESYYTLLLNIFIFATLAWYLDNVLPGEHGSPRPFYFVFTREYWGFRKRRSGTRNLKNASLAPLASDAARGPLLSTSINGSSEYDSDVEEEQRIAAEMQDATSAFESEASVPWAVRLQNISKLYRKWSCCRSETDTFAVDDVSLTIKSGELFTLLGHNGAGKTTLISMLTGLFRPSSGTATIYGLDLEEDAVRSLIGVCPQHDVLWSELTAREHLLLFARVKGIPSYLIDSEVHDKLQLVGLDHVANEKAGSFSGGMKRRLSVAVSCIGDPKLIFLDEPSSGLDPVNKRKIWRMIEGLKTDRAIVLTTHSMEEAEVLSDRLAIMAFGKVRAIGDSLHLKNKYGDGYRISMVVDSGSATVSASAAANDIYTRIRAQWPDVALISNDSGMLLLGCPKTFQEAMPTLLDLIKADSRVKEWGLSHSTLESVFLAVTRKHNFVYDEIEDPDDFVDITDKEVSVPMANNHQAVQNGASHAIDEDDDDSDSVEPSSPLITPVRSKSPSPSSSSSQSYPLHPKDTHKTGSRQKLRSYPLRALVRKNLTLQWRQRFSTICQLFTPLLIILILVILKVVIKSQLGDAAAPHIFPGMPITQNALAQLSAYFDLEGNSCQTFFAFVDPSGQTGDLPPTNYTDGGMFSHIPRYTCNTRLPGDPVSIIGSQLYQMPYFTKYASEADIQTEIYNNFTRFNHLPIRQVREFPTAVEVPDAYAIFNKIDLEQLHLSVVLGMNTNPARDYHRRNDFTRLQWAPKGYLKSPTNLLARDLVFENGYLSFMTMMSRSFTSWVMTKIGGDVRPMIRAYNSIVTQPMPQWAEDNIWNFLELAGTLLYPLGLTLQIPLYMYLLTLEKAEKLREMMLSHGLKTRYYHLVNYIFFFVIYAFAAGLFWLAGIATQSRFFSHTHWSVLVTFFLGWGFSLVSLACFVSAFLNSPRVATVAGYVIALFGTNLAFIVCVGIYGFTPFSLKTGFPQWTYIWPQFSFSRGMYLLNDACALQGLCYGPITHLRWSDPFSKALLALYLAGFGYYVLFLYLDAVLPREYGIPKHPLFFLPWFRLSKSSSSLANSKTPLNAMPSSSSPRNGAIHHDQDMESSSDLEDNESVTTRLISEKKQARSDVLNFTAANEDVSAEFARVLNANYAPDSPLVIQGLRKVYDSGKVAVRGLWMAVGRNECFGLLGENGAGKSTTLSMLTGMFKPTEGTALVGGYDITTEIDQVHLSMGLCPQFDILWSDLTVREHLLFYARLKGIDSKEEDEHVEKLIGEVGLSKAKNKRADALSGGMRRRLSIAISLVGDSKIVFLDEPTTGLDAASRRQIWAIIRRAKRGRAIILTTHSMDEAELLCNRIGILAHGKLRCIGNQQHLKTLFGEGVRLKLNYGANQAKKNDSKESLEHDMDEEESTSSASSSTSKLFSDLENRSRVVSFVLQQFPTATIAGDYHGTIEFLLSKDESVSHIFRVMESQAPRHVISDWAVSQIGLEDVFQTVVAQAEKELDSSTDTLYEPHQIV
jgi:ABC-type multidrug transport system ATPase subunit